MDNYKLISAKILKELTKPNIGKTLLQIFTDYISIAFFIWAALYFSNVFTSVLMMCLIGARQQGLGIIGHDSVHYRMSKNRFINDAMANLFIFFPLWTSLKDVRKRHLQHHQHTNTDNDPDYINKKHNIEFKFPQSKGTFIKNVIKYIFGLHFIGILFDKEYTIKNKLMYLYRGLTAGKRVENVNYTPSCTEKILCLLFNLCILSMLWYNGWLLQYFIFWILPHILYVPFLIRIRGINEHFGIKKDQIEASRTMYPTWFDELVLGISWNISYHLDHHLFPSVPSYNLRKLHKLLLQNKEFIEKAQITKNGTFGVFKECTI
jgi:fatty acid desaturase